MIKTIVLYILKKIKNVRLCLLNKNKLFLGFRAIRTTKPAINCLTKLTPISQNVVKQFSSLSSTQINFPRIHLAANPSILQIASRITQQSRTVTKFSLKKGKRKSVKGVLKRFKRLDWGGWIRTRSGRNKKMWRKSSSLKRRLRQHVFVNGNQSWLLDKMVTKFWRRPKHYIDDPYTPYHTREDYRNSMRKPGKI